MLLFKSRSHILQQARHFAKKQPPNNSFLGQEYIDKVNKDFEDNVSERKRLFYKADRLALL